MRHDACGARAGADAAAAGGGAEAAARFRVSAVRGDRAPLPAGGARAAAALEGARRAAARRRGLPAGNTLSVCISLRGVGTRLSLVPCFIVVIVGNLTVILSFKLCQ